MKVDRITDCRNSMLSRGAYMAAGILMVLVLPWGLHIAGRLLAVDVALGATFLPMQLPVLLAGFLAGPMVGLTVGLAGPLLSFLVTGMPCAATLPLLTVQMAMAGWVAGFLVNVPLKMPVKVLLAEIAGLAVLSPAYLLAGLTLAGWGSAVLSSLPGLLLQIIIIPVFFKCRR